jgi:hypothetical protein
MNRIVATERLTSASLRRAHVTHGHGRSEKEAPQ